MVVDVVFMKLFEKGMLYAGEFGHKDWYNLITQLCYPIPLLLYIIYIVQLNSLNFVWLFFFCILRFRFKL